MALVMGFPALTCVDLHQELATITVIEPFGPISQKRVLRATRSFRN